MILLALACAKPAPPPAPSAPPPPDAPLPLDRSTLTEPTVIAPLSGQPVGITAHDGRVYWQAEWYERIELRGLDLESLEESALLSRAPATGGMSPLTDGEGWLYFEDTDRARIERIALPAGEPEVVVTGLSTVGSVVVVPGGLAWIDEDWSSGWGMSGGRLEVLIDGERRRILAHPELSRLYGAQGEDLIVQMDWEEEAARAILYEQGRGPALEAAMAAIRVELVRVAPDGTLTAIGPMDPFSRPWIGDDAIYYGSDGAIRVADAAGSRALSPPLGRMIEEVIAWDGVVYAATQVDGQRRWVAVPLSGGTPRLHAAAGLRPVATEDGILQTRQPEGTPQLERVDWLR